MSIGVQSHQGQMASPLGGINSHGDTKSMVSNSFMLEGNNHKCTLCERKLFKRNVKLSAVY